MYNIAFAFFGGLAINFIRLFEIREKNNNERKLLLKDPLYWVAFFIIPALGSGLAFAYANSGVTLNPILSIQIGASAPLILKSLSGAVPINPGRIN